ncbi:hypothetical protein ACJX0J_018714, partial [Zea mays]
MKEEIDQYCTIMKIAYWASLTVPLMLILYLSKKNIRVKNSIEKLMAQKYQTIEM